MISSTFLFGAPFSSEMLMIGTFLISNAALLCVFRWWGALGVIAYGVVAILTANIQVLKISPCCWFPEPVALGTIVFSSLYVCSDLLTEFYGAEKARKALWIHFSALILFMTWMLITVWHPVASTPHQTALQQAMESLFLPIPSLVAASLLAYLLSQSNDIWIFAALKRLTKGRHLWLRTSLSNLLSGFVDHVVFSLLAWIVFAPTPMDMGTLWWSYIWGAYAVRAVILLLHTPLMYLARRFPPVSS
jgi:queuosine precursor transporter